MRIRAARQDPEGGLDVAEVDRVGEDRSGVRSDLRTAGDEQVAHRPLAGTDRVAEGDERRAVREVDVGAPRDQERRDLEALRVGPADGPVERRSAGVVEGRSDGTSGKKELHGRERADQRGDMERKADLIFRPRVHRASIGDLPHGRGVGAPDGALEGRAITLDAGAAGDREEHGGTDDEASSHGGRRLPRVHGSAIDS